MTGENQTSAWYLAQLKPNSVNIAERNLKRQGFETFLPQEEATRKRGGRFITSLQPLFPGYIFVALDVAQGLWRKVNSTSGVSRLVSFGGAPAALPEGLVEQLKLRCSPEGKMSPEEAFAPGDIVRIKTGPFSDVLAEIERTSADRRVWVLMDIMGGKTRVTVTNDMISAA